MSEQSLLLLLQLCNSSLPLGAYSYSDAIETLVAKNIIHNSETLKTWLINELKYGSIRVEIGIFIRVYNSFLAHDYQKISYCNDWLSANRESQELRQQSWQIGNNLVRLINALESSHNPHFVVLFPKPCNRAIAFSLITAHWQIPLNQSRLGYIHNWLNNLISVGIKLIPLGQTEGQKILLEINQQLISITEEIMTIKDEDLASCSWGLSLASMQHETLYSRLFRS